MNNMMDLGLEYVENMDNYDMLHAQIYEYYGTTKILSQKNDNFNFPAPLELTSARPRTVAPTSIAFNKEHFFKHILHPDAKTLLPFVDAILVAEHKNSPIYAASANLDIDRESLAQLVDRAYHLARAAGITPCPQAKALLNMLILNELLVWQS